MEHYAAMFAEAGDVEKAAEMLAEAAELRQEAQRLREKAAGWRVIPPGEPVQAGPLKLTPDNRRVWIEFSFDADVKDRVKGLNANWDPETKRWWAAAHKLDQFAALGRKLVPRSERPRFVPRFEEVDENGRRYTPRYDSFMGRGRVYQDSQDATVFAGGTQIWDGGFDAD